MNVAAALAAARAAGIASLDAQLLLGRALGVSRTALIAGDERELSAAERTRLDGWLSRRAEGVPLAYLLGEKEFAGLMLEVTADVLVPRPETETLVDWALELVAGLALPAPAVADLGTGSGAIALAVAARRPAARVTASDASAGALAVARRNAQRLSLAVEFVEGSWWAPLAGRRFDLVLANPPYIAAGDAHLAALRHEPAEALTPGGDGLGALRAIVAGASSHLADGGWLLLEHGFDQAAAVGELLAAAGFEAIATRVDLAGQARVSGGRRCR